MRLSVRPSQRWGRSPRESSASSRSEIAAITATTPTATDAQSASFPPPLRAGFDGRGADRPPVARATGGRFG